MSKNKGLGRGLDALLASGTEQMQSDVFRMLGVEQLQAGKYQPRTRMDQDALNQLAASIRTQGIMQPILVRQIAEQRYEIIAGERRWRAAQLAGLTEVPVLVREIADEIALAMSLIENIQREDLNPLEEAAGIKRLIDEFGMTHQVAADAVGRSRAAVTNLLRLLQLTLPVQALLMEGRLDMGHARTLLVLDEAEQSVMAEHIAGQGLSVREAENLVKQRVNAPHVVRVPPDANLQQLQNELSSLLGVQVNIRAGRGNASVLSIRCESQERLEGLVATLRRHGHTA